MEKTGREPVPIEGMSKAPSRQMLGYMLLNNSSFPLFKENILSICPDSGFAEIDTAFANSDFTSIPDLCQCIPQQHSHLLLFAFLLLKELKSIANV